MDKRITELMNYKGISEFYSANKTTILVVVCALAIIISIVMISLGIINKIYSKYLCKAVFLNNTLQLFGVVIIGTVIYYAGFNAGFVISNMPVFIFVSIMIFASVSMIFGLCWYWKSKGNILEVASNMGHKVILAMFFYYVL